MKVLMTYASWFGHNRAIAKALAQELASQRVAVMCAHISKITAEDAIGQDLLVLGTYTHAGRANRRIAQSLRHDTAPAARTPGHRDLRHAEQRGGAGQRVQRSRRPGSAPEGTRYRHRRAAAADQPAGHGGAAAMAGIGAAERRRIRMFARELLEACVPEPLV